MGHGTNQRGQASLTTILGIIGIIVAGVWSWKSLHYDTQDYIVEEIIPRFIVVLVLGVGVWLVVRKIQNWRTLRRRRERLMARFLVETSSDKRRDIAYTLVELNGFQPEGIEKVVPAMGKIFKDTLTTALGDKQHRVRGMAASYLGAINDTTSVRLLMKALEDDHAHVRSCAALALGRMRVAEAKDKLAYMMKEDWDQTVRSRSREAHERIG